MGILPTRFHPLQITRPLKPTRVFGSGSSREKIFKIPLWYTLQKNDFEDKTIATSCEVHFWTFIFFGIPFVHERFSSCDPCCD